MIYYVYIYIYMCRYIIFGWWLDEFSLRHKKIHFFGWAVQCNFLAANSLRLDSGCPESFSDVCWYLSCPHKNKTQVVELTSTLSKIKGLVPSHFRKQLNLTSVSCRIVSKCICIYIYTCYTVDPSQLPCTFLISINFSAAVASGFLSGWYLSESLWKAFLIQSAPKKKCLSNLFHYPSNAALASHHFQK